MRLGAAWVAAAAVYVLLLVPPLVVPIAGIHPHPPRVFLREFNDAHGRRVVKDAVLNVLAFVPLGWLLTGAVRRSRFSLLARIVLVTAACAGLSLAVETVQLFIASRFSSLLDVLANTSGALLGALLHGRHGRPAPRPAR